MSAKFLFRALRVAMLLALAALGLGNSVAAHAASALPQNGSATSIATALAPAMPDLKQDDLRSKFAPQGTSDDAGLRITASASDTDTTSSKWLDGAMQSNYDMDCLSGYSNAVTTEFVGYWGNEVVTSPQVGQVYYARVVVAGVGYGCAGPYAHIEILLPPNTTFAIDDNNKVLCAKATIGVWTWSDAPQGTCSQKPYQGTYGWVFDQTDGTPWSLMDSGMIMVAFPLVSTQKMSGIATNSWLEAGVQAIDGETDPWDNPRQGVFVADAPTPVEPAVTYDNPATSAISANSAHAHGYVYNHGVSGKAYFDFGATTSYGQASNAINMSSQYDYYTLDNDFRNLAPGATYHWLIRFVGADGAVVKGADQVFTTKDSAAEASFDIDPDRLAFGKQDVSTTSGGQTIRVTNTGAVAVAITSIAISGPHAAEFKQSNNCRARLAPGASCTIKVSFTPKVAGDRTARLNVKSANGGARTIQLNGTGVQK